MTTQTAYTEQLRDYAEHAGAGFNIDEYCRRVAGLDRARIDASIVPGQTSGHVCEHCNVRPETVHVDAGDGIEELCYTCTVTALDRLLVPDATGYIGVEIRRPLIRDND